MSGENDKRCWLQIKMKLNRQPTGKEILDWCQKGNMEWRKEHIKKDDPREKDLIDFIVNSKINFDLGCAIYLILNTKDKSDPLPYLEDSKHLLEREISRVRDLQEDKA